MFENRLLRKGPKREEVAGGWRRLHNEGLDTLYASPNTVREIKSKRLRWVEHVEKMEKCEIRNILVGKVKRRGHSEDLGVDRMIILEWILGK
jgi:hypothetical protein